MFRPVQQCPHGRCAPAGRLLEWHCSHLPNHAPVCSGCLWPRPGAACRIDSCASEHSCAPMLPHAGCCMWHARPCCSAKPGPSASTARRKCWTLTQAPPWLPRGARACSPCCTSRLMPSPSAQLPGRTPALRPGPAMGLGAMCLPPQGTARRPSSGMPGGSASALHRKHCKLPCTVADLSSGIAQHCRPQKACGFGAAHRDSLQLVGCQPSGGAQRTAVT